MTETCRFVELVDHIELCSELDANLPKVDVDAANTSRVVTALITNAAEAIGGNKGTISIRCYVAQCDRSTLAGTFIDDGLAAGPYVHLEISDTGCGMNDQTQARMFDPFFTTKFAGRGLGLAEVLGIVRSHYGAIQVDSELANGTTVTVLLPVTTSPGGQSAVTVEEPSLEQKPCTSAG